MTLLLGCLNPPAVVLTSRGPEYSRRLVGRRVGFLPREDVVVSVMRWDMVRGRRRGKHRYGGWDSVQPEDGFEGLDEGTLLPLAVELLEGGLLALVPGEELLVVLDVHALPHADLFFGAGDTLTN
jgi:hypothetical protein